MAIRKSFAIPFVILIIALIAFFSSLGFFIKSSLVKSIQSATGSEVNIAHVDVKYLPFTLQIHGLQVSDPKNLNRNMSEFDYAILSINTEEIFKKRLIIESFQIDNLEFNKKRSKPAKFFGKKDVSGKSMFQKATKTMFGDQKLVDIKVPNFKDQQFVHTNEAIEDVKEKQKAFENSYKAIETNKKKHVNDFNAIKSDYDALFKQKIDLNSIQTFKRDYDALNKRVTNLNKNINDDIKTTTDAYSDLNKSVSSIDEAAKQDYDQLLSNIKEDSLNSVSITNQVLSPYFQKKLDDLEEYAVLAESIKKKVSFTDKPKTKFRSQGDTIHFTTKEDLPTFLIRDIKASGENVSLTVVNVSSDSKRYPLKANVTINDFLQSQGEFNLNIKQRPTGYSIASSIRQAVIREGQILRDKSKYIGLESGYYTFNSTVVIDNSNYYGNFNLDLNTLKFKMDGFSDRNMLDKLIATTLKNSSKVTINGQFNTAQNKFMIDTSLDEIFKKSLEEEINAEIARIENEIQKQIDAFVFSATQEVEKTINEGKEKLNKLETDLTFSVKEFEKEYQNKLDTLNNQKKVIEKDVQNKLDEANKQAEKEAQKKLDSLNKQAADKAKKLFKF
jgi:uncharacterized protein (TIGR03545 family)